MCGELDNLIKKRINMEKGWWGEQPLALPDFDGDLDVSELPTIPH